MEKSVALRDAEIRDAIILKLKGEVKIFWREEREGSFNDVEFIKDIHPNPQVIENEINFLISDDVVKEGTASFVFLTKKGKAILADLPNRGYVARLKEKEETKAMEMDTLMYAKLAVFVGVIAIAISGLSILESWTAKCLLLITALFFCIVFWWRLLRSSP
jgi:hypothetical protein